MADFNINALGAFRNIDFGNADAIVNIKQVRGRQGEARRQDGEDRGSGSGQTGRPL